MKLYKSDRAPRHHFRPTGPATSQGGRKLVAVKINVPREGDLPPSPAGPPAADHSGELTWVDGEGLMSTRDLPLPSNSKILSTLGPGMDSSVPCRRKSKESMPKKSAGSEQSWFDDAGETTWVADQGLVPRRKHPARTSGKPPIKANTKDFLSEQNPDQIPSVTSPPGASCCQAISISSDNDDSRASTNRLKSRAIIKRLVPASPVEKPVRGSSSSHLPLKRRRKRIPESSPSDESPSSTATRDTKSSAGRTWHAKRPRMPSSSCVGSGPSSCTSIRSSIPPPSSKPRSKGQSCLPPNLAAQIETIMTTCGIPSGQSSICGRQDSSKNRERIERDVPAHLDLEPSQVLANPESLCPFCDERLPPKPSKKLLNLLHSLKREAGKNRRPESNNPFALKLPFPKHASCCQLHQAEKELIPNAEKKGWPETIDFDDLPRRIKLHRRHLDGVLRRKIDSDFFDMARKESAKQGLRKLQSICNEMGTFDVELPGYYGHKGFALIYRTLHNLFLSGSQEKITARCVAPIPAEFILRRVLVPETALCLIAEDSKLPRDSPMVRETLEDSRAYGVALFPDDETPMVGDEDEEVGEEEQKHGKRKRKSGSSDIEFMEYVKPTGSRDLAKSKQAVAAGHTSSTSGSHAIASSSGHVHHQSSATSKASHRGRLDLKSQRDGWRHNID